MYVFGLWNFLSGCKVLWKKVKSVRMFPESLGCPRWKDPAPRQRWPGKRSQTLWRTAGSFKHFPTFDFSWDGRAGELWVKPADTWPKACVRTSTGRCPCTREPAVTGAFSVPPGWEVRAVSWPTWWEWVCLARWHMAAGHSRAWAPVSPTTCG